MNELFSPTASPEAIAQAWMRERPDLDHTGLSVALRVRSLSMLIDQSLSEIAASLGLDHKELILLFALRRSGKPYCMRPTDVFRLLKVTSGAATYRVDKMVEKGVVDRVADHLDRRSQLIRLTKKGKTAIDSAATQLAATSTAGLGELRGDTARLQQLHELLRSLEEGWLKLTPPGQNPLVHQKISADDAAD
ncbi:MarR family winged helix-turn-helix transcriptional regulator [Pseudomonas sp. Irchel s3f19]|uniref:MarR family winged helix-turn-helix transcriptional regulator n=1 Tax=Pseudomonas sp. Irchel s3f19 TaxID=2009146 RepID=UPI000BA47037|nr:MarR family winged helix-turn-helix transcriptional regulator [Pseudomonas sp. Irchel s3f19]